MDPPVYALVAQLDRVSDYESEGQEFESLQGHHIETTELIPKISVLFSFLRAILLVLGLFLL